jgi:hypothetical protein
MPYYHVLLRFDDAPERDRCVFSDLSESDLKARFVTPYKRGKNFLSESEVIEVSRIRKTTIICTNDPSESELKGIQEKSRKEIDEINRTSSSVFFVSAGPGYDPEDVAEAGVDVTATFITGPPGEGDRLALVTAIINHPWISAIGTGLIVAALAWLLGLT